MGILYFLERAHGYEIYKIYREIFPKCTQRVVYYHLNQGVKLNLFEVDKIIKEEGNFSWGTHAEKIYYALGRNAFPKIDERVKKFLENRNTVVNPTKINSE